MALGREISFFLKYIHDLGLILEFHWVMSHFDLKNQLRSETHGCFLTGSDKITCVENVPIGFGDFSYEVDRCA